MKSALLLLAMVLLTASASASSVAEMSDLAGSYEGIYGIFDIRPCMVEIEVKDNKLLVMARRLDTMKTVRVEHDDEDLREGIPGVGAQGLLLRRDGTLKQAAASKAIGRGFYDTVRCRGLKRIK